MNMGSDILREQNSTALFINKNSKKSILINSNCSMNSYTLLHELFGRGSGISKRGNIDSIGYLMDDGKNRGLEEIISHYIAYSLMKKADPSFEKNDVLSEVMLILNEYSNCGLMNEILNGRIDQDFDVETRYNMFFDESKNMWKEFCDCLNVIYEVTREYNSLDMTTKKNIFELNVKKLWSQVETIKNKGQFKSVDVIKENNEFQHLLETGEIEQYVINDTKYSVPNGGVLVELPNNEQGIAIATVQPEYYVNESVHANGITNKVKILKKEGTLFKDITEPELITNSSSQVKLARDENYLYVTTYNTKNSYLAKYKMETFEKVWKKDLGSASMQSIAINENSIICFNMTNGSIDYFDKIDGEQEKSINIKEDFGHNHHNLTATNLMLLAAVPGSEWILDLPNQLKAFDNNGKMVNKKEISIDFGMLNAVSSDEKLNLVYLAFDNKIITCSPEGCLGVINTPYSRILELNVDASSSSLIVSSSDRENGIGGKINVLSPKVIKKLLKPSVSRLPHEPEIISNHIV